MTRETKYQRPQAGWQDSQDPIPTKEPLPEVELAPVSGILGWDHTEEPTVPLETTRKPMPDGPCGCHTFTKDAQGKEICDHCGFPKEDLCKTCGGTGEMPRRGGYPIEYDICPTCGGKATKHSAS